MDAATGRIGHFLGRNSTSSCSSGLFSHESASQESCCVLKAPVPKPSHTMHAICESLHVCKPCQVNVLDSGGQNRLAYRFRSQWHTVVSTNLEVHMFCTCQRWQVNVLDKSKADWQQMKAGDATLEEELEAHR
eukprot:1151901-Pelagomonas_calceolata.AAC.5